MIRLILLISVFLIKIDNIQNSKYVNVGNFYDLNEYNEIEAFDWDKFYNFPIQTPTCPFSKLTELKLKLKKGKSINTNSEEGFDNTYSFTDEFGNYIDFVGSCHGLNSFKIVNDKFKVKLYKNINVGMSKINFFKIIQKDKLPPPKIKSNLLVINSEEPGDALIKIFFKNDTISKIIMTPSYIDLNYK